jgi:A118 family predicted phage portal protein
MVKNIRGDGKEMFYQEINPELNTDTRLTGINALLGQIGYKVGFSNGHFVFNETAGIQTATQVEADQQRTIQFVKDVRDKLESCLTGLIYALNVFADLYGYAPRGAYEVVYDFGDITYNRDEDRIRWWGYVQAGKVPAWKFFVKFEGMTEQDAKDMVEEALLKAPSLFE